MVPSRERWNHIPPIWGIFRKIIDSKVPNGKFSPGASSLFWVIILVPLKVPTKRLDVLMFVVRRDDDGNSFDRCIWDQSMPKYRMCHQPRFPWNYGDFPSKKLPEMGAGFQFRDFTWRFGGISQLSRINRDQGSIGLFPLEDHHFKREWFHDRLETTLPRESCILPICVSHNWLKFVKFTWYMLVLCYPRNHPGNSAMRRVCDEWGWAAYNPPYSSNTNEQRKLLDSMEIIGNHGLLLGIPRMACSDPQKKRIS